MIIQIIIIKFCLYHTNTFTIGITTFIYLFIYLFIYYRYSTNKVSSTTTHELDDTLSNDVPDRATWMFRKFPELRKLGIESSGDDEDDDEEEQDNKTAMI